MPGLRLPAPPAENGRVGDALPQYRAAPHQWGGWTVYWLPAALGP